MAAKNNTADTAENTAVLAAENNEQVTGGTNTMAITEFNSNANPTVDTKCWKFYADVKDTASSTAVWELQGRGVESWTEALNIDTDSSEDVLGYVDFSFSNPKPTQDVDIKVRKDSKLGGMLFDAYYSGKGRIENIDILQKYEMVDAGTSDAQNCKARIQKGCAIVINEFQGEAGGKLTFSTTWNYTGQITTGKMPKTDGATVTFTADE